MSSSPATLAPRTGRPRAVIYCPGLSARGGAERVALQMGQVLLRDGWHVDFATESADIESVSGFLEVPVDGSGAVVLPPRRPRGSGRASRLWASLRQDVGDYLTLVKEDADLFVNVKFKSELPSTARASIYYVHFPQTLDGVARRARFWVMRGLAAVALRRLHPLLPAQSYSLVAANSFFTARHTVERWGIPARVLYPAARQLLSAPARKTPRSILSVGRIVRPEEHVPNKRHDVLIDAFASANMGAQGWTLTIVGACSPEDSSYYEQLIGSAPRGVVVLPNVPPSELERLWAESDVYWHAQGFGEDVSGFPECHEHFGISVVEAMASGLMPIVHDGAGPSEIVGGVGKVWRDPVELVVATETWAALPDDEKVVAREALRERASRFSEERFAAGFRQVVERARRAGST